jgi:hypothetical protein
MWKMVLWEASQIGDVAKAWRELSEGRKETLQANSENTLKPRLLVEIDTERS